MQIYHPGTHIGQYEIASNPMIGGMGVVYFCLDHGNDGRPVALKTFKPEYLPDRAARDRFLREGTAWVQLGRHPHIVRCYAVEYIDPTTFLSLELIAKEQDMDDASLRSWIGAPMPVDQALLFALQIARGMKHATEKIPGFVHRDLKPENVLVGAEKLPGTNVNRLRVTDFGLAAILKDEIGRLKDEEPESIRRTHLTHGIVGTPLYMAPEQWKGEPVGVYTDVYALGCILYEMLTGQRAASGRNISELRAAHCGGKLRSLPPSIPADVAALLKQSLTLAQSKRYGDWESLTIALENIYAAQSGQAAPQTAAPEALSRIEQVQAGWSYNEIGRSYHHMGRTGTAVRYFEQALALARQNSNRSGEGAAQVNLGLAYAALGDARQSISFYEQALVIYQEISDKRGEGASLGSLGNAYAAIGDYRRAISYYEQQLVIVREIGDWGGEDVALSNLGIIYKNLGDTRRAIRLFEQSLVIARKIGDRRNEGKSLGDMGNAHLALGNAHRAISFYEQWLTITRETGDRRGEGQALGNMGAAYNHLGNACQAITLLLQQLAITREIRDRHGEGNALSNLALAYDNLNDTYQAIEYYKQRLEIAREIGDRQGEAVGSWNLGLAYEKIGDLPNAVVTMQICVDFECAISHPDAEEDADRVSALRAKLEGISTPQTAFEAFQHANSPQAMQVAIGQHPILQDRQFIQMIEKIIKEQAPPEQQPAFMRRLAWLKGK